MSVWWIEWKEQDSGNVTYFTRKEKKRNIRFKIIILKWTTQKKIFDHRKLGISTRRFPDQRSDRNLRPPWERLSAHARACACDGEYMCARPPVPNPRQILNWSQSWQCTNPVIFCWFFRGGGGGAQVDWPTFDIIDERSQSEGFVHNGGQRLRLQRNRVQHSFQNAGVWITIFKSLVSVEGNKYIRSL